MSKDVFGDMDRAMSHLSPFGGFKQSDRQRELGERGLHPHAETKTAAVGLP
ncbi:hypothetical protein [Labrys wisconsinensis]|uniref:Acyl-CoA reductase-like NAD-dependent aldehyde dehydrogenase n=1 Tax=Labrys wisconsinensis TaxID=425677 RepID=A0ABU0JIC2_9HYPH|nr:hypothetical protein [Labrys wisconsinensis]MDQ0473251.1 acyl-CoA reductase-like NAD-dependent aldehyde dehydrogenase [Labrys wisconsinensis]